MTELATTGPGAAVAGRARLWRSLAALAAIALVGIAAYFAFPEDLALMTRIVIAALFVLSLDLVIGYCGVATLGHAALFGIGAYAAGYACVQGLTDPIALLVVGGAFGAMAGLVMGGFMAGVSGLPQLVLSIALVQLVHEGANKWHAVTGGSDGLAGIMPAPLFGVFAFDLWGHTQYLFALGVLIVVFAALMVLVQSPFGMLCRAIKADPVRVRSLGTGVYPSLVKMYVISGAVAGIAGGLTAVTAGVIGLDSVSFEWSAEALVMLVLGGAGSLYGALVGAVVFTLFEHVVSAANPFHWLILVGVLLIACVLFLPRGLQSLPEALARLARRGGRS